MENASKALLIAGSILIVILLIAVGMKVFNSTTGTTDSAKVTMNATETATFNSKFLQYVGTNKSRATAISALNAVIANNSNSDRKIGVSFVSAGTANGALFTNDDISSNINILENKTYTIGVVYDNNGYINCIRVY